MYLFLSYLKYKYLQILNMQLIYEKMSIFSLDFPFKCILHKTSQIVCHRVRKIILMQMETRIFLIFNPIVR